MLKKSFVFFLTLLFVTSSFIGFTPASAGVDIGNNDSVILDSSSLEAYKKLALLGSVGDLVSSGADSIDISGASDVDSLLDSILENLATGLTSDNPVSEFGLGVWESLNEFNQFLTDKAYDLANSFNYYAYPDFTSLINAITGTKVEYKRNPLVIDHFKALSKVNDDAPVPQPDPDFSFISNVNNIYLTNGSIKNSFYSDTMHEYNTPHNPIPGWNAKRATAYFVTADPIYHTSGYAGSSLICAYVPLTINLYVDPNDSTVSAVYSSRQLSKFWDGTYGNDGSVNTYWYWGWGSNMCQQSSISNPTYANNWQTSFAGLSTAINYIYSRFANINLYVDGSPWVLRDDDYPVTINLDIPGFLKLYNSPRPVTYYYPAGTKIDYNALYEVILRAIQNGTPVTQTTINNNNVYYDSHDSVYSPTIYNYYGTGEDEGDFIDDILNLATIPNFDTALVEPLSEPMTNGAAIVVVSTSVFPRDILVVLGAGFVLVLFVALINRLIE